MQITLTTTTIRLRVGRQFDEEQRVCKSIPSGVFNRKEKVWEYPHSAALEIAHKVPANLTESMSDGFLALLDDERVRYNRFLEVLRNDFIGAHDFLYGHQVKCNEIADIYDRFAFFLDTGTGKTLTGLSIVDRWLGDHKWCIIPPLTTVKHAWVADAKDFYPHIRVFPITTNYSTRARLREVVGHWPGAPGERASVRQLKEFGIKHAHVYLVNTESFSKILPLLKANNVRGCVFDESVKIKNPHAGITRAFESWAPSLKRLYLLSGKPAPNGEEDYFTQMRVVDPSVFGVFITKFKELFFQKKGMFDIELKPGYAEVFSQRLARKSLIISKQECLDLPPETYSVRSAELPSDVRELYKKLQREFLLTIQEQKVRAANAGVLSGKLRQLTSGFLYPTADTVTQAEHKEAIRIHDVKLKLLSELLERFQHEPVVIWIAYQEDVRIIGEHLEKHGIAYSTAYGGTKDIDSELDAFMDGRTKVIIAHPRSVKYGISFVGRRMWRNCTEAIFYSYTESYDDFYQAKDRINRNGQNMKFTYHFLIVENTIDELTYKRLRKQGDAIEYIEGLVKQCQEAFE